MTQARLKACFFVAAGPRHLDCSLLVALCPEDQLERRLTPQPPQWTRTSFWPGVKRLSGRFIGHVCTKHRSGSAAVVRKAGHICERHTRSTLLQIPTCRGRSPARNRTRLRSGASPTDTRRNSRGLLFASTARTRSNSPADPAIRCAATAVHGSDSPPCSC